MRRGKIAEEFWQKHQRGEPLDEGPRKGEETIASTWPLFRARLTDDGKSPRTIEGYEDLFNRISDDV